MDRLTKKQVFVYITVVLVLFCIPIYIIITNTQTLKHGEEFLFKVEAYDPYDMFRGNYLEIRFEENEVYSYNSDRLNNEINSSYYVRIGKRSDGYAYFQSISDTKPTDTSSYYKTKAYSSFDNTYTIETPTRYYMNEKKSLRAEAIYQENIENSYVKVRVKDGKMLILGIYVNGMLIDTIEQ
ncbi:MAG: GDYXXLXY domain-containing protein [Clostridia bacterium]|nr:GDYXXLXY domain-containing protein [Clostridia bacterium]MDD4375888.1 GDYXXLXY domain-containing protein [Clostridia bacterium]